MPIYSFYSVTDPHGAHHQIVQSAELNDLPVQPVLHELARLRALVPAGQPQEMMAYHLGQKGYSIIGLSFLDKQNVAGSFRKMNCSLQYIASYSDLISNSAKMGDIVNFINFQKPTSSSPESLGYWPMMESGYYYHNSVAVLAPLVDSLAKIAMSPDDKVMLIGLPKEKKNTYAFARYTMAEMLGYLPEPVRANIRFFIGLPVEEGVNDAKTGLDNAVKYGANVVFCPQEFYEQVCHTHQCISVNMDQPSTKIGAFADFITHTSNVSGGLAMVDSVLGGRVTYESLNVAGQQVKEGKAITMDGLREEIVWKSRQINEDEKKIKEYQKQIDAGNEAYKRLQQEYMSLKQTSQTLEQGNKHSEHDLALIAELQKKVALQIEDNKEMGHNLQITRQRLEESDRKYQQLQNEYDALVKRSAGKKAKTPWWKVVIYIWLFCLLISWLSKLGR